MHYEIVTGECHEAVVLMMRVKLVSSKAVIDVILLYVVLTKEGIRLLSNFVTTICLGAKVRWNTWVVSLLDVVVSGNSVGEG